MDEKSKFNFWRILPATILMIGALWTISGDPWRSESKRNAGPFDGEWRFSRLLTRDVKPILDAWHGSTLVIKKNKATFQIGKEITEYDFSPEVVNENPTLVLDDPQGGIVYFLYDLDGDTLLLSYLPHAVPRRLDEGILVEFKRRR